MSSSRFFQFIGAAIIILGLSTNGVLQHIHTYVATHTRNPPPNYDKWLSFALKKKCPTHPNEYTQIYKDLAPWMSAGTIRSDSLNVLNHRKKIQMVQYRSGYFFGGGQEPILNALKFLFPKDFKFFVNEWDEPYLVPADNNTIFMDYNSNSHVFESSECFRTHFDTILQPNATLYPFANPNSTLRMQHGFFTSPTTFLTKNSMTQIFSQAKTECFTDILLPHSYHVKIAQEPPNDVISFDKKLPVVFWRGSSTGGSYSTGTPWPTFPRTKLMDWEKAWALRNPSTVFDAGVSDPPMGNNSLSVDIGFNAFGQVDLPTKMELKTRYGNKTIVPFTTALKFKYLIVVDGNTWPSRLQRYLQTNSVVLYAGIFTDFFNWRLKPWVHYVPVRLDFSDLEERLTWLKENDAEAREIVKRANEVMKIVNRMEYLQCYTGLALLEYSALLDVN